MYQTRIEVALDDVRKINVGKFCVLGNTFCTGAADQAMRQVDPLIWIGNLGVSQFGLDHASSASA
jgi:hypothetical protein